MMRPSPLVRWSVGSVAWLVAGLIAGAAPVWAADDAGGKSVREQLALDASLRGSYWSSDRQLSADPPAGAGTLWLRMAPALTSTLTLKLEGWVTGQPAADKEKDERPANPHELREAYLAYLGDALEVRAGRQIAVWGRADRLNPTDNLTSRDFRLLFPEDDDQRRGSNMLQVAYPVLGAVLRAYWIPEFRPNTFPTPPLAKGIAFRDDERPHDANQGAFKIDRGGGAVDWSLSYFEGRDRNPDVALDHFTATGGVVLQRRYGRVKVTGADAAATLGKFGLRAEIAHTLTEDENGKDPEVKNGFLYAVAGADRTFFEYLNVNAQYIYRQTEQRQDPRKIPNPLARTLAVQNAIFAQQLHRVENGASLRISYQFLNETLTTEIAAVQFFQDGDAAVSPKITYKATDTLRLTLGGQVFSGPAESFFGGQQDNTNAYLEVRWGY
jgi:hypothetical protein